MYDDGEWHTVRARKMPPLYRHAKHAKTAADLFGLFERYGADTRDMQKILCWFLDISLHDATKLISQEMACDVCARHMPPTPPA